MIYAAACIIFWTAAGIWLLLALFANFHDRKYPTEEPKDHDRT